MIVLSLMLCCILGIVMIFLTLIRRSNRDLPKKDPKELMRLGLERANQENKIK